jgi:two-component system OmpR family sensor kinase
MRKLSVLALYSLPLLLLLGAAELAASEILPNPVFYLRADMAALLGRLGVSIFVLTIAAGAGLYWWTERVSRRSASRAHLRAQLQATDDRRRFLQRLDHELKNPLTAIRAGLANLSQCLRPGEGQNALASVEAETLRLSRLTADLRKLAELETRPLERVPVDLAELLQEASNLVQETSRSQSQAQDRYLALTLPQAPWPLPAVRGDWDLLFLAVYNLLDNAYKFTQPGDTVEVRAFEDGALVVLEIADTGPGIPEAEVPHVWEELYRGQGARGVRGSGLGLALVRAVAERHGGRVTLRSRVDQGTVVTLRLPLQ